MPRIELGTAGCEARTLSIVLCGCHRTFSVGLFCAAKLKRAGSMEKRNNENFQWEPLELETVSTDRLQLQLEPRSITIH